MRVRRWGAPVIAALVVSVSWTSAAAQPADGPQKAALGTPPVIATKHQHLRDALARAAAAGGAVGDVARSLERTLSPHLKHDEELVMPLLGLLRPLMDGADAADAAKVAALAAQIERAWPQRLAEHRIILDGARRLKDTATREGKREFADVADLLWTHAVIDDQVLYPASILVARYVASKPAASPRARSQGRPQP
jgi:hypothetical protein